MSTTVLINATPFAVTLIDGRSETISLARLSIRQLYVFTQHLAGERVPELVVLCTGKSAEWLDTLSDESFAALVNKCVELNFPRAGVIAKSDPTLAALLIPFAQKMQTLLILAASLGLKLNVPSPEPASAASAGETGNASSTTPPSDSSPSSPSTAA